MPQESRELAPRGVEVAPLPVVGVEAVLGARDALVVDLRSPSEHADDHLPGARSVPLFDDLERGLVGLLYRQSSPEAAFGEGRAIVEGKVEELVARIVALRGWELPRADLRARVRALTAGGLGSMSARLDVRRVARLPEGALVLHCWRGGMRSRSVVALLRSLGFERVVGLEGGYKSYRRGVIEGLAEWEPPPAYVLRGLTGVGKTLVLRALEELVPRATLDLEAAAGHRSSLLGMVGLEPCSQRAFESRLGSRLRAGFAGAVVVEGESRKVGDALIPARVWRAVAEGTAIELIAPLERRLRVLMDDYLACEASLPRLRTQLGAVAARMGSGAPLVELFDAGRFEELCVLLLERYYDPLYRHGERGKRYELRVDSRDPRAAAAEIAAWIGAREPAFAR